jgi:hypothetical protein
MKAIAVALFLGWFAACSGAVDNPNDPTVDDDLHRGGKHAASPADTTPPSVPGNFMATSATCK